MRTLGNILWLILGGLPMAFAYAVAGVVMFVLIITIPFGIQAFKLAGFALWPFGRVMVEIPGKGGCLNTVGNVIWIVLAGIWLAIAHLFWALLGDHDHRHPVRRCECQTRWGRARAVWAIRHVE